MGTFWLPFLGHIWKLLGRLFGEGVPSVFDRKPEFQNCSFQKLGARPYFYQHILHLYHLVSPSPHIEAGSCQQQLPLQMRPVLDTPEIHCEPGTGLGQGIP